MQKKTKTWITGTYHGYKDHIQLERQQLSLYLLHKIIIGKTALPWEKFISIEKKWTNMVFELDEK